MDEKQTIFMTKSPAIRRQAQHTETYVGKRRMS